MTTTIKGITTDKALAYAVGTAAAAWDDTDYWTDETGNVIGLKRGTTYDGQALGLYVDDDVVSWGLWQYDADGCLIDDDGLSYLTDETIGRLADKWQASKRLTR